MKNLLVLETGISGIFKIPYYTNTLNSRQNYQTKKEVANLSVIINRNKKNDKTSYSSNTVYRHY